MLRKTNEVREENEDEERETVMLLVTNKQFKFIVEMVQHLHSSHRFHLLKPEFDSREQRDTE